MPPVRRCRKAASAACSAILTPAKFGPNDADNIANLAALADNMVGDFDAPKDGPDGEESGIPALYTYFGQFIDHDITFDP